MLAGIICQLLVCAVLVIGLFIAIRHYLKPELYTREMSQMPLVTPEWLEQNVKTMSLIAVTAVGGTQDIGSKIIQYFTKSRWHHMGFCYRPPNGILQVCEINTVSNYIQYSLSKEPGPPLVRRTFKEYYQKHSNAGDSLVCLPCITDVHDQVTRLIDQYAYCSLTKRPLRFLQALIKRPWSLENDILPVTTGITCTEFVVFLLQQLGIYHKVYRPANYHPGELIFDFHNTKSCKLLSAFGFPLGVQRAL